MRPILAMIVLAAVAGSVRADVAPLPFQKHVRVVHRIETQEQHPDYVFVLSRHGGQYDETTQRWESYQETEYVELMPDRPLVIRLASLPIYEGDASRSPRHGDRIREEANLYCIPRSLAQAHPSAKDAIKATKWGETPGTFWERFDWREVVPSWADDESTITYHVQRKPSEGGLEIVRTSRNPRWQWNAAAIGVSICLAATVILFGLWLVRRMLRSRPIPTAK